MSTSLIEINHECINKFPLTVSTILAETNLPTAKSGRSKSLQAPCGPCRPCGNHWLHGAGDVSCDPFLIVSWGVRQEPQRLGGHFARAIQTDRIRWVRRAEATDARIRLLGSSKRLVERVEAIWF